MAPATDILDTLIAEGLEGAELKQALKTRLNATRY